MFKSVNHHGHGYMVQKFGHIPPFAEKRGRDFQMTMRINGKFPAMRCAIFSEHAQQVLQGPFNMNLNTDICNLAMKLA